MDTYKHTVHYYETDKMGITHHSNYIRWMEEARVAFLSQMGWPYDRMEKEGIISPVTAIDCKYRTSTTFAEDVFIQVSVEELKGARLKLRYLMRNQDDVIVCEARSEHGFINTEGRPIRLKKEYPDFYQAMEKLIEISTEHEEA